MSRSRFKVTLPPRRRSALGIRRIGDVDIGQVLHASKSDIDILQSHLHQWGVSEFRSYPLLLRALTHPSISNWAERILELPKRSLGPNTLEILGDRVVGACTAHHVLDWTRQQNPRSDVDWTGGPRALQKSLSGNRGMAETARSIGIESLVRWEKPTPPASHRPRVNSLGIDLATGIQSNVEVNCLAAAYESTAAAIYLDGGLDPALSFVNTTLLRHPLHIQHNNRECSNYEAILSAELEAILGTTVTTATSYPRINGKASAQGRVTIEIFDFQQELSEELNEAHVLFYTGVSIRRTSNILKHLDETNFISLASHFSVETARLAALTQAIAVIRGEAHPIVDQGAQTLRNEKIVRRNGMSDALSTLTIKVNSLGQWQFNRDYAHVAKVFEKVGSHAFGTPEMIDANLVRATLQAKRNQRNIKKDEGSGKQISRSSARGASSFGTDVLSQISSSYGQNKQIQSGFDIDTVGKALEVGQDVYSNLELTKTHDALLGDVRSASEVVDSLDNVVQEMNCLERHQRLDWLNAYYVLGNQSLKLWAVQRSIENVAEDRAKVAQRYEQRIGLASVLENSLIGAHGLRTIRSNGTRMGCVALGMCAERVGMTTTLVWLTGEEAAIK